MKTRFLRDIEVSEVGMGCMAFSHGYGQIPDEQYSIPYHNDTSNSGFMFDVEKAKQFPVENLLVVLPGEEIAIR